MSTLSNLFKRADPAGGQAVCRPAVKEEFLPALRLILGSGGRPANEELVTNFLRFALQRNITPQDIWVAVDGRRIVWAILPMVSPGRSMLLFASSHIAPAICTDARRLIEAVCAVYQKQIHLAQVLLDPTEPSATDLYQSCRFKLMAELVYLQIGLRGNLQVSSPPTGFTWKTYAPALHDQFAATILESYRDSLDCPSLNGMRDIEDIIAGHKAAGVHDASLWFLLCEDDLPRGVLLLSPTPQSDTMELVYLGLVPGARGRGLSDVLMRQALAVTSQRRIGRFSLAVDSHNAPAIKLYYRNGLQRVGSKLAMMRDLRVDHC